MGNALIEPLDRVEKGTLVKGCREWDVGEKLKKETIEGGPAVVR